VRVDRAEEWVDRPEAIATSEAQARREAIPQWSALGLSVGQIAAALGLAVTEVED
jgi:predicted transposase YdaD